MFDFLNVIHWDIVAKIIGIDIMLGGDNAIVIAMACAGLAASVRTKGVVFGTLGAVLLRAILLFGAAVIFEQYEWLKIIAGAWLLVIGVQLLQEGEEEHVEPSDNLWGAIKTIIIADLIMSIDNVVAVSSAAQGAGAHADYYAIAGICLSIPIIVGAANILMGLMEKFPVIVWAGAGLLGWVGVETVLQVSYIKPHVEGMEHLATLMGALMVIATAHSLRFYNNSKELKNG